MKRTTTFLIASGTLLFAGATLPLPAFAQPPRVLESDLGFPFEIKPEEDTSGQTSDDVETLLPSVDQLSGGKPGTNNADAEPYLDPEESLTVGGHTYTRREWDIKYTAVRQTYLFGGAMKQPVSASMFYQEWKKHQTELKEARDAQRTPQGSPNATLPSARERRFGGSKQPGQNSSSSFRNRGDRQDPTRRAITKYEFKLPRSMLDGSMPQIKYHHSVSVVRPGKNALIELSNGTRLAIKSTYFLEGEEIPVHLLRDPRGNKIPLPSKDDPDIKVDVPVYYNYLIPKPVFFKMIEAGETFEGQFERKVPVNDQGRPVTEPSDRKSTFDRRREQQR